MAEQKATNPIRPAQVAGALTLGLLGILVVLCVIGACLGPERASDLFNSAAVMVCWAAVGTMSLLAIVFSLTSGRPSPGLVIVHLAVLAILVGSFAGSARGHLLAARFLHVNKVRVGYLPLNEGETSSAVLDATLTRQVGSLPFKLHLNEFSIGYHALDDSRWKLLLHRPGEDASRRQVVLEWEVGKPLSLGAGMTLHVLQYKPAGPLGEPAGVASMEVAIEAGGKETRHWLIPDTSTHIAALFLPPGAREQSSDTFLYLFQPKGPVREYKSDVVVMEGDRVVGGRSIRVNSPLHYGGYHIYQYSFEPSRPGSTILMVRSDSGVALVYVGFVLLAVGTVIWGWGEQIWTRRGARATEVTHGA